MKTVNSNALLADVISSSGAKLGHIGNLLKFESLDKYQNIVVFAGINNIPGPHERVDEETATKQITSEVKALETELTKHVNKGKNVFLTQVANSKHARMNKRNINIREEINKNLHDMKTRLKNKNKKIKTDTIGWNPFVDEDDFSTVKSISQKAMISFLNKVEEKVEGDLRAPYLDIELTADEYSNVTPSYPPGCRKCTKMDHAEEECPSDLSKKRNRSEESDGQGPPTKATSMEHTS